MDLNKVLSVMAVLLLCFAARLQPTPVHAANLPSLSDYGVNAFQLSFPDTREGYITEVLKNNEFIIFEKIHVLCKESEIDGIPVDKAKLTLKPGTKVKITRYRLGHKKYFVSDMTIIQ